MVVVSKIIRAMRPLSAPKRSANNDTLLALGNEATSSRHVRVNTSNSNPMALAMRAATNTNRGCTNSLSATTGK